MQDYHIHSNFSGDSDMPMETACSAAINLGLKEIAFTDHIDLGWPGPGLEFENINLEEYTAAIRRNGSKYSKSLSVKLGIEIGLQPQTLQETRILIENYPFDYIIASVHCVDCFVLGDNRFFAGKTVFQAYERYFKEVLSVVTNFDHFCTLGHIDVMRRYIPTPSDRQIKYADYLDVLDSIFLTLINKNKGIEINTSGFRYGLESFLPPFDFIKRYKELGGEIITIGSDAHSVPYIGCKLKEALDIISSCGFKYYTSYTNMTPTFINL